MICNSRLLIKMRSHCIAKGHYTYLIYLYSVYKMQNNINFYFRISKQIKKLLNYYVSIAIYYKITNG